MVKNLPANVGDARDMGLISVLGRSTGVGNSGILAWENTKTEKPGGLPSMGLQRVRHK